MTLLKAFKAFIVKPRSIKNIVVEPIDFPNFYDSKEIVKNNKIIIFKGYLS